MKISDVFDYTSIDNNFAHHMSNFGHMFLHEPDITKVQDAPTIYENVGKEYYIHAACFVHFWLKTFIMDIPEWLFDDFYKYDKPVYSHPFMKEHLEKMTPSQFKFHNNYMLVKEVTYI